MTTKEKLNKIIDISIKINRIYQIIATEGITDQLLNQLKKLISEEKPLYESLVTTLEECAELISEIENKGLDNSGIDDEKEYAINRMLNKLKYIYIETTYSYNGAYKHLIDKYTQMLYSEFINNASKYPDIQEQMTFSAFYIASLSPYIELDLIERQLIPYETYDDELLIYARLKRMMAKKISKDFKKNEELYGIDHIYRENTESFIHPYISYTLKVLLEEFKNDNNYYLFLLTELKVQLAMLPKIIREKKYQEIIELFESNNISVEKLKILKESFVEIETTIVPKISYYPQEYETSKVNS